MHVIYTNLIHMHVINTNVILYKLHGSFAFKDIIKLTTHAHSEYFRRSSIVYAIHHICFKMPWQLPDEHLHTHSVLARYFPNIVEAGIGAQAMVPCFPLLVPLQFHAVIHSVPQTPQETAPPTAEASRASVLSVAEVCPQHIENAGQICETAECRPDLCDGSTVCVCTFPVRCFLWCSECTVVKYIFCVANALL
jgi:hypothetical protein